MTGSEVPEATLPDYSPTDDETNVIRFLRGRAKKARDESDEAFKGPAGSTIALAKCAEMVALNMAAGAIQKGQHRGN